MGEVTSFGVLGEIGKENGDPTTAVKLPDLLSTRNAETPDEVVT